MATRSGLTLVASIGLGAILDRCSSADVSMSSMSSTSSSSSSSAAEPVDSLRALFEHVSALLLLLLLVLLLLLLLLLYNNVFVTVVSTVELALCNLSSTADRRFRFRCFHGIL